MNPREQLVALGQTTDSSAAVAAKNQHTEPLLAAKLSINYLTADQFSNTPVFSFMLI
jgi:hypothetical protein